jgi:GNAT superfamily N-acetyltransferase
MGPIFALDRDIVHRLESPLVESAIRPYKPAEDENFVFHSWLQSHAEDAKKQVHMGPVHKRKRWAINPQLYYEAMRPVLRRIVAHEDTRILMAVYPDAPDKIRGWICYAEREGSPVPVLHYVYVKHTWRKLGVASQLMTTADLAVEIGAGRSFLYTFQPVHGRKAMEQRLRGHAEYLPVERYLE